MERATLMNIIGKHFDYSFDFKFIEIVRDIIERIDFDAEDLYDEMYITIADTLIYYNDMWVVAMHYTTPIKMVWSDVMDLFLNDVYEIVKSIKEIPFDTM